MSTHTLTITPGPQPVVKIGQNSAIGNQSWKFESIDENSTAQLQIGMSRAFQHWIQHNLKTGETTELVDYDPHDPSSAEWTPVE